MLGWRLVMSAILVPAIVAMFWLDQKLGTSALILLAFCLFVAVRNAYELSDLLNVRNIRPHFAVTACLSCLVVLAGWGHLYSSKWQPTGVLDFAWLDRSGSDIFIRRTAGTGSMAVITDPGHSMESLGGNLLTVFYAGGLIGSHRSVTLVSKSADWLLRDRFDDHLRQMRRHDGLHIWPTVGQAKTGADPESREDADGTCGSSRRKHAWRLAVADLRRSIVRCHDSTPGPLWNILAYSAVIGLIGLVGDLCESLIKRDVQKKDSAILMPGFGGLLDLLDSPLFAGPFALAWWTLLPPAT